MRYSTEPTGTSNVRLRKDRRHHTYTHKTTSRSKDLSLSIYRTIYLSRTTLPHPHGYLVLQPWTARTNHPGGLQSSGSRVRSRAVVDTSMTVVYRSRQLGTIITKQRKMKPKMPSHANRSRELLDIRRKGRHETSIS